MPQRNGITLISLSAACCCIMLSAPFHFMTRKGCESTQTPSAKKGLREPLAQIVRDCGKRGCDDNGKETWVKDDNDVPLLEACRKIGTEKGNPSGEFVVQPEDPCLVGKGQ
jgi:hypothetical protein